MGECMGLCARFSLCIVCVVCIIPSRRLCVCVYLLNCTQPRNLALACYEQLLKSYSSFCVWGGGGGGGSSAVRHETTGNG